MPRPRHSGTTYHSAGMSRQRRRRLDAGINAVRREGAGVLHVMVYRFTKLPQLLALAEPGNEHARALALITATLAEHDAHRGGPRAVQCFCCGTEVDVLGAVALITGDTPSPAHAVAGLICRGCGDTHHDLRERVAAVWCEQVDPTARRLDVHPAAGRA